MAQTQPVFKKKYDLSGIKSPAASYDPNNSGGDDPNGENSWQIPDAQAPAPAETNELSANPNAQAQSVAVASAIKKMGSGISIPEHYQTPTTQPENETPDGYDLSASNDENVTPNQLLSAGTAGGTRVAPSYERDPNLAQVGADIHDMNMNDSSIKQAQDNEHVGAFRRAMSILGGVGAGLVTHNIGTGMNVAGQIAHQPLNSQIAPLQRQNQVLQSDIERRKSISGLGATLDQRQAELDAAAASQTNAKTSQQKEGREQTQQDFNLAHPEVHTEKTTSPAGNDVLVSTPTHQGAGQTSEVYTGGSAGKSGDFETKVGSNGELVVVDKVKGTSQVVPIQDKAGKPVKLNGTEISNMNTYVEQYVKKAGKDDAATRVAGMQDYFRQQPGVLTNEANTAEKKTSNTSVSEAASGIANRVRKMGITDPAKALEMYNTLAALLVNPGPGDTPAQKALRAKYKEVYKEILAEGAKSFPKSGSSGFSMTPASPTK